MRLASDLHMTLKQLAENMTQGELTLWIARYMLEHDEQNSIGARAQATLHKYRR